MLKKTITALCLTLTVATAQAQIDYLERLNTALEAAELFLDTCQIEKYTYGQVEDLRDAIIGAKNLMGGEATNPELSKQRNRVSNALDALKVTYGKPFNIPAEMPVYDTHRGFIHPGGLHTQADFDRIKQQLANGNPTVTAAYNVLKNAEFAQPGTKTYPVETIVRGGGVGENYINAARGATIAYQNGLRWKIEGNEACAKNAVDVLMQWARVCKHVGGDSNYALASGLYGYQFAQAAELVRDYEGWSKEEFQEFCQWMLDVWYRPAMGFLRGRNGTWENGAHWWEAPGHYWSNWGLCNAMCIMSMGVLLDDVFIYNQGLSFIKHDQCGTFTDPRVEIPIKNDGLTEFWGNLIVTTTESPLETGAYGKLGQMNESGRDGGHAAMALGLAVDVAHQGYNQGDDLFAFMDHRLAAGIEFTAACTDTLKAGIHRGELPFTEYLVANNGIYYHDGRVGRHTEPALEAHTRNYWGSVIGHYEGVKGVKMPFSDIAYENMTKNGPDGGGAGAVSGGYDHLGYSVLMNTHDRRLALPSQVPTELAGHIIFNGVTLPYNELGGLTNTYRPNISTAAVSPGQTARLVPVLPEGETDTGNWLWDSGETSKELDVTTDRSQVYRVTYTNKNGIKSQQCFSIAVQGDCRLQTANTTIKQNGAVIGTDEATVQYGSTLTLTCSAYSDVDGWSSCEWENGSKETSITTNPIVRDRDFLVVFTNQGGGRSLKRIRIHVNYIQPIAKVNDVDYQPPFHMFIEQGDKVVIGAEVNQDYRVMKCAWNSGETTPTLTFENAATSVVNTLHFSSPMVPEDSVTFRLFLKDAGGDYKITPGNYLIRDAETGKLLTNMGDNTQVEFTEKAAGEVPQTQIWYISDPDDNAQYNIQSLDGDLYLRVSTLLTSAAQTAPFRLEKAVGVDYYALRTRGGKYLWVKEDNKINYSSKSVLDDYPFLITPYQGPATGIETLDNSVTPDGSCDIYDLQGRQLKNRTKGITIVRQKMSDGSVQVKKVFGKE